MKSFLCLLILPTLLLACMGNARRDDSGRIVVAGDIASTSLRVGDCFQDWQEFPGGEPAVVSNLQAVPCSEAHDNEVFHVIEIDGSQGDNYLESFASAVCLGAFESYIGRAHAGSRLDYGYIRPTQKSRSLRDERRVTCFLFDSTLAPLTGSMRGSRQ